MMQSNASDTKFEMTSESIEQWRTVEQSIVAAFLGRDVDDLARIAGDLVEDSSSWGRYYCGLAKFFLATTRVTSQEDASRLAHEALELIDNTFVTDPDLELEMLVLSGSISGLLAKLSSGLQRSRIGLRSLGALERAAKLDPYNPRAQFANASAAFSMNRPGSRDSEEAFKRLLHCEKMFERPGARDKLPQWGHIHVQLFLVNAHLRRQEVVLAQQVLSKLERTSRGMNYPVVTELAQRVSAA